VTVVGPSASSSYSGSAVVNFDRSAAADSGETAALLGRFARPGGSAGAAPVK